MGRRTGRKPKASDPFLMRVCYALDLQPEELAVALGVKMKDMEPLLSLQRRLMPEIHKDEIWWELSRYVSERIGMLMAVRHELDVSLQKARAKRVHRTKRLEKYHGKEDN